MSIIKVFAKSRTSVVAGAIAGVIHDHQRAELLALGEEAINRALRAVDLTIVYFKRLDIDIHCMMKSADETLEEDTRPALSLIIEPQSSLEVLRIDPALSNFELELENSQV